MPKVPLLDRLLVLLLGVAAPAYLFGVHMDADWYWREDLNGLLHMRAALHGVALLGAATTATWLLLPRRSGSRLDAVLERSFPTGLLLGFATTLIPTVVGTVGLLEALLRDGAWREALLLLHPLGYALTVAAWLRAPARRVPLGIPGIAGVLVPFVLVGLFQLVVWRAEHRCFAAVRAGSETYLALVEDHRSLAWAMNLDPLLTTYLREAGYLAARPLPETIPANGERGYRIARAWRVLTGEEIGDAALERYRILSLSKNL